MTRRGPFVSIIIPARNEARHIAAAVRSALEQTYPPDSYEVIVADGMSDDGTVWEADQAGDGRVNVIANPGLTAAAGLNEALRIARGDVIARLDAHATAPPTYLERGVRLLHETGAWSVGGWVDPVPNGAVSRAMARSMGYGIPAQGWVETAPYGMWPRWVFDRVGGFDETLERNQDDEFSLRIRQAGGRVWADPELRFGYVPRASWDRFAGQHFRFGYWKVRVWRKHHHRPSVREVWPAGFVLGLPVLLLPYLALAYARTRDRLTTQAYLARHTAYGVGLLRGLLG